MYLVGVNVEQPEDGDFARALGRVVEIGGCAAEIDLDILPFILNGQVSDVVTDYAREVMRGKPLRYSAHVSCALDMRSRTDFDDHENLLRRSIDVCGRLGVEVLTVHYEDRGRITWVERRFLDAYRRAADYAGERNVKLAMENIEIEDYRLALDFVSEADRENLLFALDTGHLFLSCGYFGQDFSSALQSCAALAGHVHLNDNAGKFMELRITDFEAYRRVPMNRRALFGMGDVHFPPGFGALPFDQVFDALKANLKQEDVFLILEYGREAFRPFERQVVRNMTEKAAQLNADSD